MHEQLNLKIIQSIRAENANGLQQYLAEFTKAHQTFAIYEFYSTIKSHILQHTNGEFLAQQPLAREKMLALRWLEITLKDNPYQLSIMLLRADVALYKNQLDKASKLFRQILKIYMSLFKKNNLPVASFHAWQWMLKDALFIEPAEVEGAPYSFIPLQLPDSLINKAPETIVTAYGNAPYIQKYAARMVNRMAEIMPEVEILLVVGNEDGDTDADTDAIITELQQKHPKLHIAYDIIPDIFKQKHLRYLYCTCRRFTYLQDILVQSACKQVVTIDIDSFIQPVFKTCVDYTTDAPIGYKCDEKVIFFPSNLLIASYFKIDNSDIGRKFSQKLYDYLSKKFSHKHALWFVDQYALLHAWQTSLTAEEQQKCRNIYACNTDEIDVVYLHSGGSQDEQALFAKERVEKETRDSRLVNIIMPEHVRFDEQTLHPILNFDWDK